MKPFTAVMETSPDPQQYERFFRDPVVAEGVLQPPMSGTACTNIRTALRLLGYPVDYSERYDDALVKIVRRFQDDNKHPSGDGFVGPGTRRLLARRLLKTCGLGAFKRLPDSEKTATGPLVFISAKSADYESARQVYQFLISKGTRAFFSQESLPTLAISDYRKQIDQALDQAKHLILVASSLEHVLSPWVEAEWGLFLNEKRSGRKTGNLVTLAVGDLRAADLPASLRYYSVIPFRADTLEQVLQYVRW
jgi:peptidoglycan hydrolase-like protein with peptidoglycan-binding domain